MNPLAYFLEGYMQCALWSSNDPDKETPLDDVYSVGDIEPDLVAQMAHECAAFLEAQKDDLDRLEILTGRDMGSMGHDLWLTRNGHGAGYWDRYMEAEPADRAEAEQVGKRLSAAAEALGVFDIAPGGEQVIAM